MVLVNLLKGILPKEAGKGSVRVVLYAVLAIAAHKFHSGGVDILDPAAWEDILQAVGTFLGGYLLIALGAKNVGDDPEAVSYAGVLKQIRKEGLLDGEEDSDRS